MTPIEILVVILNMKNLPVYLKGKFSANEYKYITSIISGQLSQKLKKEYEKIQPEIIKER